MPLLRLSVAASAAQPHSRYLPAATRCQGSRCCEDGGCCSCRPLLPLPAGCSRLPVATAPTCAPACSRVLRGLPPHLQCGQPVQRRSRDSNSSSRLACAAPVTQQASVPPQPAPAYATWGQLLWEYVEAQQTGVHSWAPCFQTGGALQLCCGTPCPRIMHDLPCCSVLLTLPQLWMNLRSMMSEAEPRSLPVEVSATA